VQCHKEKSGPFLFEHDPVTTNTDDSCLTCHASHGSANKALLRLPPRATCLQCHSERVNHHAGQECATCHTELHGSNVTPNFVNVRSAPSSRAYTPTRDAASTASAQLSYGYNSLDLDGNSQRFFRYSYPPADRFFLQNLTVQEADPTVPEESIFSAYGLDAKDQAAQWKLNGLQSLTEVKADYSRYNFFRGFEADDLLSQRLQSNINFLFSPSATRTVSLSEAIDNVGGFPAAKINYASSSSSLAALLGGPYNGWLKYNFESFQDNSGSLFNRRTQTYSFTPARAGRHNAYSASIEVRNSDLEGNTQGDRRTSFGLSYSQDVSSSTSLYADLSRRSRPQSIAENAYTNRADVGEVGLLFASARTRLTGGFRRTEMERRNRSQTATEPVSFNRWWLKATAQPCSWLKLRASDDQRSLDEAPTALNHSFSPIPNLVPDEVTNLLFRAEANLKKWGNIWAERSSRRQELTERNTSFRENADKIGISTGLPFDIGFTGSLANVGYSSSSAAFTAPFSDYDYLLLSLWRPVKNGASLSANYSLWDAKGANETKESALSLGYQLSLRRGGNASAEYQFVKDSDAGPLDFSASILSLTLGFPF
jgi:predicted CXXCH cytochrome family protein